MFERSLALKYIKAQKRHSIFTICSITVAIALMTLLFTGFATFKGIVRGSVYMDKPYHFKLMKLTEEEYAELAANDELSTGDPIKEIDGTVSAEVMINSYHEDIGLFIYGLFPEKQLYSDRYEEFDTSQIDVNYDLISADKLDFSSRYESVRDLAAFFVFVLLLAIALRLMIDTAFEISSKEREKHFGVLQCVGAEPAQIVRMVTFEGLFLSVIGLPLGMLLGIGVSAVTLKVVDTSGVAEAFFTAEKAKQLMHLHIDPLMLLLAAATGLVWVFLSAYQTGMRVIKKTPVQAIFGDSDKTVKVRKASFFGSVFGWQGKLASRNNSRQRKRFAITVLSLTVSIALFASFTIVLKQSLNAFEKLVDIVGLNYDMGIAIKSEQDKPRSYKEGYDAVMESGLFEVNDFCKEQVSYIQMSDGTLQTCVLRYYPRGVLEKKFQGELPVSYDELTEQGAYIMMSVNDEEPAELYDEPKQIEVGVMEKTVISDEEYANMSAADKENVKEYITEDFKTGEKKLEYRFTTELYPTTLNLVAAAPMYKTEEGKKKTSEEELAGNAYIMAGTLDYYNKSAFTLAGKGSLANLEGLEYIHVDLVNDDDYEKAKSFVKANAGLMTLDEDYHGDLLKMRSGVGAIKIGSAFLSVLIGLIALVNMVNILSTGLLNRKSELASMQCMGMTRGQLYGMTVVECLQYSLTSGVLATGLIEALMALTLLLLKRVKLDDELGSLVNFAEPVPKVWIAAAAAFVAAVIASVITLHRINKESLTDQMRTVE
ncbi:MAG: FtsX-like permease family protein [Ruminococcus albus]|jgi:putative ABC transport system permease protein|nr:FtsX-like permease family protein [Ruminococcus albus]